MTTTISLRHKASRSQFYHLTCCFFPAFFTNYVLLFGLIENFMWRFFVTFLVSWTVFSVCSGRSVGPFCSVLLLVAEIERSYSVVATFFYLVVVVVVVGRCCCCCQSMDSLERACVRFVCCSLATCWIA